MHAHAHVHTHTHMHTHTHLMLKLETISERDSWSTFSPRHLEIFINKKGGH